VTPLDQLRLRLPAHELDRLMQAAKPVAEPDRDAMLKDIATELGQHEVVGPGLLHRIIKWWSSCRSSADPGGDAEWRAQGISPQKAQPNPRPTGGRLPRRTPRPLPVIPIASCARMIKATGVERP
jgi:hypothetical protein